MNDFLVKIHIHQMDPKIQTDQLAIQDLFLLLVLLLLFWGSFSWDKQGTQTQLFGSFPKI